MIRQLSFKRYLLLLLAVFAMGVSYAQTTINTTYSPVPAWNVVPFPLSTPNTFITFRVTNSNAYAVKVTDVAHIHIDSAGITTGSPPVPLVTHYSNNGAKYTLWYTSSNIAGGPNVSESNGWVKAGEFGPVTTTGNNITTVMSGAKGFVPPSSTVRFALAISDTIMGVGPNPTPSNFTNAGVTLNVAGAYWGALPGPGFSSGMALNGSITFERGVPEAEVEVSPKTICIGTDVTLVAKAATYINKPLFRWYRNGTQISTNDTLIISSAQLTDAGPYKVVIIDTTGGANVASDSATAFVDIKNPKAPSVSGKTQYCLKEPFQAVTVNGPNPKWYYVQTGGSPIPITPTFNTTTANNIAYYVSQTVDGCESSDRTRVYFSAAPKPPIPASTTPIYYCENNPADQLIATGDNIRWYYSQQGGVPTAIAPKPGTTVKGTTEYFVSQTVDGCESDRKKVEVIVTFRPNGLILPSDRDICAGDSIEVGYYGSAFPNSAYNWSLPDGATNVSGIDQGPLKMTLNTPGVNKIALQVGNVGCYSKLYEETITVKPIPTAEILAKDELCLGQSDLISLQSYTKTIDTFLWDFAGGERTHFSTDQGPYGVFWSTSGNKIISVTVIDNECKAIIRDTVNVHAKPDATILAQFRETNDISNNNYSTNFTKNYNGEKLCAGDSLKLSVSNINASNEYTWSPARFFETSGNQPVTFGRIDFNGYIKLRVQDQLGCYAEDSLMVDTKSCCAITFPTAFSPNNDGKNDLFRPISLGNYDIKTFRVLNRYGQTIFETRDLYNGWDGTFNGEPQDLNTYFYLLSYKCNGEELEEKGEFILVR